MESARRRVVSVVDGVYPESENRFPRLPALQVDFDRRSEGGHRGRWWRSVYQCHLGPARRAYTKGKGDKSGESDITELLVEYSGPDDGYWSAHGLSKIQSRAHQTKRRTRIA
jgi:hypothetical protein